VPNRQLVLESDRLALLYNDQSVAEQRSLAIAFAELTKDQFQGLREVLFENVQEYRRFRKTVINLVLTTDIASPERTQVVKSKWKEAFGDASRKDYPDMRVDAVQMVRSGDAADDSSDATSVTPESDDAFDDYPAHPLLATSRSDGEYDETRTELAAAISPKHATSMKTTMQTINDVTLPLPLRNTLPANQHSDFTERLSLSESERSTISESVQLSAPLPDKKRTKPTRRFSMPTAFDIKKTHVRLGIRRSLDLTGETIEPYSGPKARSAEFFASILEGSNELVVGDPDEPDELRASVIMEQLIKAADVAPLMQGWDHMEKWSARLFFELMDSHESGRGEDPRQGWFENQITFLESYLLPLARRLHATKAFGNTVGPMFARTVEENRDRWISDGVVLTEHVTQKWIRRNQNSELN
jgi:hypothetical protein